MSGIGPFTSYWSSETTEFRMPGTAAYPYSPILQCGPAFFPAKPEPRRCVYCKSVMPPAYEQPCCKQCGAPLRESK